MSESHIRELAAAKKRIESGENNYVCDALRIRDQHLLSGQYPWTEAGNQIVEQIRADLNHRFSLAEWLQREGFTVPSGEDSCKFLQATRLAWIDAMIEYWRSKP